MHVVLKRVLTSDQIGEIKRLILAEQFVDGRIDSTLLEKKNLQLPKDGPACKAAGEIVTHCLNEHETFKMAVLPHVILSPLFSKYDVGMEYPDHVDQAIMSGHRTDVSLTVFLNDPAAYDGGELVVDSGNGERKYKLDAGDAIAYPSSTLHHVAKVTQGTRLAAVLWVQSWIRDSARRQILYDIGSTAQYLTLMEGPYSDRLRQSYVNLVRCWADA